MASPWLTWISNICVLDSLSLPVRYAVDNGARLLCAEVLGYACQVGGTFMHLAALARFGLAPVHAGLPRTWMAVFGIIQVSITIRRRTQRYTWTVAITGFTLDGLKRKGNILTPNLVTILNSHTHIYDCVQFYIHYSYTHAHTYTCKHYSAVAEYSYFDCK